MTLEAPECVSLINLYSVLAFLPFECFMTSLSHSLQHFLHTSLVTGGSNLPFVVFFFRSVIGIGLRPCAQQTWPKFILKKGYDVAWFWLLNIYCLKVIILHSMRFYDWFVHKFTHSCISTEWHEYYKVWYNLWHFYVLKESNCLSRSRSRSTFTIWRARFTLKPWGY